MHHSVRRVLGMRDYWVQEKVTYLPAPLVTRDGHEQTCCVARLTLALASASPSIASVTPIYSVYPQAGPHALLLGGRMH
jgi:hypothetical protein